MARSTGYRLQNNVVGRTSWESYINSRISRAVGTRAWAILRVCKVGLIIGRASSWRRCMHACSNERRDLS